MRKVVEVCMHSMRLLVPVLMMSLVIPAVSQTSTPSATFKSRTDLVLVPVVVHDKQGRHLAGLSAADFTVDDNGAQQTLASVEEITADTSPASPPPDLAADVKRGVLFTNQVAKESQPKQVLIFAVDLVNAPFVDTEMGRRAMLSFVASHMSPNRTMGLVSIEPGQVRLLHAFTSSPTVLSAALQKVTAVTSTPATQGTVEAQQAALQDQKAVVQTEGAIGQFIARAEMSQAYLAATSARNDQNIATALEALRQIGTWVAGVPGRKVLVWLTGNIPFVSGQGTMALGRLGAEEYERTMKALATANVAVYPVDVRGVVPQTMYVKGFVDPGRQQQQTMAESLDASPSGIARRSQSLQVGVVHMEDAHEAMNYFANLTGGRAYYNRNDIPRVLDDAADDSSRYYMLSYYLDRSHAKPGWHKLKVSVHHEGVTVHARNGFFVPKPSEEASASAKQQDESTALASPFEYTALPVNLKWMDTTARGDKRHVRFEVYIPASSELVGTDRNTLDLDVIATALGGNREVAGQSSKSIKSQLKPQAQEQVQKFGVTYVSDLDLKPGEYAVRLVVRDNLTGRLGSITAPLRVGP
jgi:VWFA-related protein